MKGLRFFFGTMGCLASRGIPHDAAELQRQAEHRGFQQVSPIGYQKNWTNWLENIKKPEDEQIEAAIDKMLNERHQISTVLIQDFDIPSHISDIICEYYPTHEDNKISFLSTFDHFFEIKGFSDKACIQQRCETNIRRFINDSNKHLFEDLPSFKRKNQLIGDNIDYYASKFKNVAEVLDEYIVTIFWYRTGTTYKHHDRKYPPQPSDIFGKFRNGLYFYFKDGHPSLIDHSSCRPFTYYAYCGKTIKDVLNKMDKRDIEMLINDEKIWEPDLDRCGCWICHDYQRQVNYSLE